MKITHKEMLLEVLNKHNACEVIVGGTSMWPFVNDGDVVSIKQKPFVPSLGKVIAFFSGEQLIIHRIVWCREKAGNTWDIWVHGDGCPYSLAKISSKHVVGTIAYVRRKREIITYSVHGIFRLVAIPIGFIIQLMIIIKTGR